MKKTLRMKKTNNVTLKNKPNDKYPPKIANFLNSIKNQITKNCPYKMNLLKNGARSQNKAGLRISENGSQIKSTYGQLFYYDLVDNAMRVPHWHANGDEIGIVLEGKIRITHWNGNECNKQVFTAEKDGSWYIPRGTLHCLENLSDGKTSFLVGYNHPNAGDRDFLDAWSSLPAEIITASTYLSKEDAAIVKRQQLKNRLSKFEPTTHLASQAEVFSGYTNNFNLTKPLYSSSLGEIKRIDHTNTIEMKNMGWQKTTIKPGTLRVPHWYTNTNVIYYVNKGKGFVTMLDSFGGGDNEKNYKFIVERGDIFAMPVGCFHSVLNIINEDLEFFEILYAENDQSTLNSNTISILIGIQALSSDVAAGALGLSVDHVEKMMTHEAPKYMVQF